MPGMPLMPGVIMCEAAAQVAATTRSKAKLMDAEMVGYGGLEDVRFRGVVRPGDRFVIVARLLKVRRSMLTCEFQCFVAQNLVCEGILKGIALPVEPDQRDRVVAMPALTVRFDAANTFVATESPPTNVGTGRRCSFPSTTTTPRGGRPVVTYAIIAVNVLVFLWLSSPAAGASSKSVILHRGFIPARIAQLANPRPVLVPQQMLVRHPIFGRAVHPTQQVHARRPTASEILLSLLTCMFLHGGWMHLIGNMWFLWLFGNNVEDRLGPRGVSRCSISSAGCLASAVHWLIRSRQHGADHRGLAARWPRCSGPMRSRGPGPASTRSCSS